VRKKVRGERREEEKEKKRKRRRQELRGGERSRRGVVWRNVATGKL
jgi:hypothetical protein